MKGSIGATIAGALVFLMAYVGSLLLHGDEWAKAATAESNSKADIVMWKSMSKIAAENASVAKAAIAANTAIVILVLLLAIALIALALYLTYRLGAAHSGARPLLPRPKPQYTITRIEQPDPYAIPMQNEQIAYHHNDYR